MDPTTACPAQGWLPDHHRGLGPCEITAAQMWTHYLCLGGSMSRADFAHVIAGRPAPGLSEHNLVVQALNEHLLDHGQRFPVPYLRHLDALPAAPRAARRHLQRLASPGGLFPPCLWPAI